MASKCAGILLKPSFYYSLGQVKDRLFHTSSALLIVRAGRIKRTPKKDKPVTYEEFYSPPHIAHRKSWNSWNTSTIEGGLRQSETMLEDIFIRKFMEGTFPRSLLSKVIIKRQHNIVRIAAIVHNRIDPSRMCFLIGYTEELLSYWLHCCVKLELQVLYDPSKMIFTYL